MKLVGHVAYFISSHGLGHAARASAVIAELARHAPESRFTLFTTVPEWFFAESLEVSVRIEPVDTDLGLVQSDALTEDLPATVEELRKRIPFRDEVVSSLARRLEQIGANLVVCDIAPLGIAVARHCGLPSVLIENFTWDWIYRGYLDVCPQLAPLADALEDVFHQTDHHIQTEPVCVQVSGAMQVAPVSRAPRSLRAEVRRRLGIPEDDAMAVVTMGGVAWSYESLAAELTHEDPWLVIPGSRRHERSGRHGRIVRFPHRSDFYHPDLIHAADAVVGKLGYSTLAEVWSAGVPMAYLTRPRFQESEVLEAWVRRELACRRIEASELRGRAWLEKVRELVSRPREARASGAAGRVAKRLRSIM